MRGSDRKRQETQSAGHRAFSASGAGHRLGPDHSLKVETRVRTPLGLRTQTCRSPAKSGANPGLERTICWALIPRISRDRPRIRIDAVARVMPDRACHFAFHPIIGRDHGQRVRVSTCKGWRHATSIIDPGSLDRTQFVGVVGTSPAAGRPRRALPDNGDQRIMSLIQRSARPAALTANDHATSPSRVRPFG